jgi:5,10-methylenetetrahydrofolate reductase
MLRYMNRSVPGVEVPDQTIDRMNSASDPGTEGLQIAIELIDAVKEVPGVRGVHLQAIEAEHLLPELIERAGLLPRP